MEIDRLSLLPDDLLVDILDRLYPYDTKVGAKTATLSKRWRFLWTKLPLFAFRGGKNSKDEIGRCFGRVGEALAARRKAILNLEHYCGGFSLHLSLGYDAAFADDLVKLLDFAAGNGVRDVDLDLTAFRSHRSLPQALYSYPSLRKLSFPPDTRVEWGLMTEISLNYVKFPQEAMDQIISGCPLLIRLKIHACSGFNRLDVGGRCFRELYVHDNWGCSELLEISAPYMTSMHVSINPGCTTLRLTDVSSVEHLRIAFQIFSEYPDKETEMFRNNKQLFQLLQRVTSLGLNNGLIQVVVSYMREDGGKLPQFNVRHLTIKDGIRTLNINGVLAVLKSSPFLEKLVIQDMSQDKHKYMDWNLEADSICDLLHLKSVEIRVSYIHRELLYITLAQILLMRAPVLEEMVIMIKGTSIDLVKKFDTYPKSSQKAVVHIISS